MDHDVERNPQEPETGKIIEVEVVPITKLLQTGATSMGTVVSWWAMMLMQGGIFFTTVETMDCLLVLVIIFLIAIRRRINLLPTAPWPRYKTDRSMWANIKHLEFPISLIDGFSYWCKLVSAITCAVLSMMRLVSQDFGPCTKEENKATRNFALNVFYVSALIETLLTLLDLVLQNWIKPPKEEKKDEQKVQIMPYIYSYSPQQDQSINFRANRRKEPTVYPAEKCKQTEEKEIEAKKSQ